MTNYKSIYTGAEIDSAIGKANTALQEHQPLKTINNESLVGDGNITIEGTSYEAGNNIQISEENVISATDTIYDDTELREAIAGKQEELISGTNIKTINGNSILGEGNLVIEGGEGGLSSIAHDDMLTGAGTNASPLGINTTKIAQKSDIPDVSNKQDTLVSGTNIKTINNTSLLGSGNIDIQGGGGTSYNPFNGKKVSILGDSISTYRGYIPEGYATYFPYLEVNSVDKTWWYKLIQDLNMVLGVNNSYSGSTVSGSSNQMASVARIQDLGRNGTPDVILFYGGTNDMLGTIGTFDATQNYAIDLTTTTWNNFATAYKDAIMRLQYYYPSAMIIAISPIWVARTYTPSKLNSGIEVLKQICNYFGVNYIDLRKSGFSTQNLNNTLLDGVHPNVLGMSLIEEYVKKHLLSFITPFESNIASVVNALTHVTTNNAAVSVTKGSSYSATLVAENGYVIDTISVVMNGKDITSTAYDNGVVAIANVTGNITITATAVASGIVHTVTNDLTNVSNSNSDSTVPEYSSYNGTLSATEGYSISTVTVIMGGTDITNTAYNNGVVSIAEVTGDIIITATAVAVVSYTITNNLTNVSNSNISSTIMENASYNGALTVADSYVFDTVTVIMGGTDITNTAYDSTTGIITIAAVTGNIVITAVGVPRYTPGVQYDLDLSTMVTATRSTLAIDENGFLVQSYPTTAYPEILLDANITEIEFDVDESGQYTWVIMAGTKDHYGAATLISPASPDSGYPAVVNNGTSGGGSWPSTVSFAGGNGHYKIVKGSENITWYKENNGTFETKAVFHQGIGPLPSFSSPSEWRLGFLIQQDSPTGKGYKNIKVKFGS